ncbi:MAG: hypothetical protein WCG10_04660, partial [Chlamydiota bacterium]
MSILCKACHIKFVHPGHPYCGKTCARKQSTLAQSTAAATTTLAQAAISQIPGSTTHSQDCRCTAFTYPGAPACTQQAPQLTRTAVTTAQVGLKCLVPSCQLP